MRRSALQLVASLINRAASGPGASAAVGPTIATSTGFCSLASTFHRELSTLAAASLRTSSPTLRDALSTAAARAFQHQTRRGVRSSMHFPSRNNFKIWQARFDPDANKVIWSLIAANGAVYMLWRVNPYVASKHFVVSLDSLREGRVWTAVTAAFSQADTMHLASNCISLYFFGSDIGRIFGGRKLLLLYLAGGIAGSIAHCAHSYYKELQRGGRRVRWGLGSLNQGALGASAAVNAIMLVDILLFPTRTILLYGFIPLPAALLGLLWLWNDIGGALDGGGFSKVAHSGHLGGAATGLAFYVAFRRGMIRPRGWW